MTETTEKLRYGFGENWADFIDKNFSEEIVDAAQRRLGGFLRLDSLKGLIFLDIGCGSGLHSLAAYRLGAERIISFDYDPHSVATTERLRQLAGNPPNWAVRQGSVLDRPFMEALPKADIVYSWGVLHHTGDMWRAVRNAAIPMKSNSVLFIALYAADNFIDPPPEYWLKIKRRYNLFGRIGRRLMEWWYVWKFHVIPTVKAGANPLHLMFRTHDRGMRFWTDIRDWLGGWPMDFASLAETRDFAKQELGLDLVNITTNEACFEYLLCRLDENAHWGTIEGSRTQLPLTSPFSSVDGFSYSAYMPALADCADSNEAPRGSRIMLYEDGIALGFAHSLHDHIARYGKGRFSHWGDFIYFSASDSSDPNVNKRRYTYCEHF